MSMAERKTMTRAVKNPVKRKLTRAEKKEIAAVIQAAKGDGKPHTAQQTIPYLQMYPDGICRVTEKKYSKSLVFEDINYQLAQADDKTAIFENWCDFLNYFDASVTSVCKTPTALLKNAIIKLLSAALRLPEKGHKKRRTVFDNCRGHKSPRCVCCCGAAVFSCKGAASCRDTRKE